MTKLLFRWIMARPDSRDYRMNSTELSPDRVFVEVDVPDDQVKFNEQDEMIITPNAMRLALASLESVFVPTPSTTGSDKSEDGWDEKSTDDGWNDAQASANHKEDGEKNQDDNDGWGNVKDETFAETEKTETSSEEEVFWNEDTEKWE